MTIATKSRPASTHLATCYAPAGTRVGWCVEIRRTSSKGSRQIAAIEIKGGTAVDSGPHFFGTVSEAIEFAATIGYPEQVIQ